jgi:hypothetical protein
MQVPCNLYGFSSDGLNLFFLLNMIEVSLSVDMRTQDETPSISRGGSQHSSFSYNYYLLITIPIHVLLCSCSFCFV